MTGPEALFSVVVPCYGHEQHVTTAIESLWAQSFEDFDIIAINDGSPDGTAAVLDSLASRSPRPMRVVHTTNRGAHIALNTGAALAGSRYLAFLNDDDEYHPDRLDVFARAARICGTFTWGFGGVEAIDELGQPLPVDQVPDIGRRGAIRRSIAPIEAVRVLPYENTTVSSGNLVIGTELFRKLGGFREFKFVHDWDLVLRLLATGTPFVAERPLYRYRVHRGNAYNSGLSGGGARLAVHESEVLLGEFREQVVASARVMPYILEPSGYGVGLNGDDARAVRVTLWALAKIRTVPPAYAAVRLTARLLRRIRRYWR